MPYPFGTQAAVTNGEQTEIVITGDDRICLYHEPTRSGIYLGAATRERVDQIIFNLQQLRSVMPGGGQPAHGRRVMAIAVGFSRTGDGKPTMDEKAFPTSEQRFYEDGPTPNEEAARLGYFVDGCDLDKPSRRYSHSSADLQ